jgi:hypothetical protein
MRRRENGRGWSEDIDDDEKYPAVASEKTFQRRAAEEEEAAIS